MTLAASPNTAAASYIVNIDVLSRKHSGKSCSSILPFSREPFPSAKDS